MTSTSTTPSSNSSRRGLPKWLKATIITVLVLANLLVVALLWAVSTGRNFLAGANTDSDVVQALTEPSGDALTFLVVGSDSRQGLDDLTHFGSAGGERGDVIMLVRLDPSTGGARILSIPRDLWVDIPGHGMGKINAAYAYGGPTLMVETVKQNLGVAMNHYVEVGFTGFVALVDQIGGVELDFPFPARDASSGLDVGAGTQVVDGDTALAFARSRKYQELRDGSWVSVEANDIGRTGRQQVVVEAILRALKTPGSLAEAGQIANSVSQHLTIDSSLAEASVAGLAWDFRGLLSGAIDAATLPVDGATIGGASVVLARQPEASEAIDAFLASGPSASSPVRIQVLNGNGIGGSAGRMSVQLEAEGFVVLAVGDAATKDYEVTTIMTRPGSDAGEAILGKLGFGRIVTGEVGDAYDAVLIVGKDYS